MLSPTASQAPPALTASASSEAMMAWIGIRPLAISWPPEWRAAAANGRRPAVLPDQHAGYRARLHGRREVLDVVLGEDRRQNPASRARRSSSASRSSISSASTEPSASLARISMSRNADRARIDQCGELLRHLAGEMTRSRWELDDHEVDRSQLVENLVTHVRSFGPRVVPRHSVHPRRSVVTPHHPLRMNL